MKIICYYYAQYFGFNSNIYKLYIYIRHIICIYTLLTNREKKRIVAFSMYK